ncbi:MAG: hypothetical protein ACI81R_001061 [Bradymonadia bacterium]|jgi:hypothetical protein
MSAWRESIAAPRRLTDAGERNIDFENPVELKWREND